MIEHVTHPARDWRTVFLWREVLRQMELERLRRREIAWESAAASADYDRDGVPDHIDNCPDCFNPRQDDHDLDGMGDACDWDDDNDRDPDRNDPRPLDAGVSHGPTGRLVYAYGLPSVAVGGSAGLVGGLLDTRG